MRARIGAAWPTLWGGRRRGKEGEKESRGVEEESRGEVEEWRR
jgi:hypothetical protein